jgi:hypothetical protein
VKFITEDWDGATNAIADWDLALLGGNAGIYSKLMFICIKLSACIPLDGDWFFKLFSFFPALPDSDCFVPHNHQRRDPIGYRTLSTRH